ncbi:MAG: hypothetical protein CMP49_06650 [Flavobacteriales bacterium]|nr:hypothetical protein [Flavobacteriales bacterium]
MKIKLIVAASENNVIGVKNDLPWHLPNDMDFFKRMTLNTTVIMGRKNYLSIPEKFRPLKNRKNIIITKNKSFFAKDCIITNSLESAIQVGKKEKKDIFIIGGGMVYSYAISNDLIDLIYLTRVHAKINGDTFFPEINMKQWEVINSKFHKKDKKHKYDFTFLTLKKISQLAS